MDIKRPLDLILLVDDNLDDNYFHRKVIKESKISEHVEVCTDGEEALEYMGKPDSNRVPDIIFLDINMPKINGWEFLELYQKLEVDHDKEVIIIMLTTSPNPEDARRVQKSAILKRLINKPLKGEHLEEIIEKYFQHLL